MESREYTPMFEHLPQELRPIKQWVLWTTEGERKAPINPFTLGHAGINWRNTWGTYKEVIQSYQRHTDKVQGIGFVVTTNDPFVCIDLDDCYDFGGLTPLAKEIVGKLAGYTEKSPSGNGLHIWIRADYKENHKHKGLEIYSSDRWLTMTGQTLPGMGTAKIPERTAELQAIIEMFQPSVIESRQDTPTAPVRAERTRAVFVPDADDTTLWQRLFSGRYGHVMQSLYNGDTSVCFNDESRAVIFLANRLAVATGFDESRIKRMLYQTGLVSEKWETRRGKQTWLDGRIQDAIRYMQNRRSRGW